MPETYNCSLISILVCSKDRHEQLNTLIQDLKRQVTNNKYEIIVVEETDNINLIQNVRYISHPVCNKGIAYARNLAIKNAIGDIIAFVDDDCRVDEHWLYQLTEPFRDKHIIGVQGGVVIPEDSNTIGWCESLLGFPGGGIKRILESRGDTKETTEISTLNCAYRKWVLDEIGGFDERLKLGGEDYQLAKKACKYGRCVFVPSAMVKHIPRGNLIENFKWFYRRGKAELAMAETGWRKKEFYRYWMNSSIIVKGLLLLYVAAMLNIVPAAALSILPLYYFVILSRNWKTTNLAKAPSGTFLLLPFVKLVMDMGNDLGRSTEALKVISSMVYGKIKI